MASHVSDTWHAMCQHAWRMKKVINMVWELFVEAESSKNEKEGKKRRGKERKEREEKKREREKEKKGREKKGEKESSVPTVETRQTKK